MRVVADRCHVLITVGLANGETKRPRQDRKPDGDARRRHPSDLSDAGWAVLQPLMPVREARKGGAYLSRSPPKCPNVPTSPAVNGSDRLVVELVEPPDTPPFIANWPPKPTVCAQAQFDQIVVAAMRLLSTAVVALAAIRVHRKL
jgi:hypothetical protein